MTLKRGSKTTQLSEIQNLTLFEFKLICGRPMEKFDPSYGHPLSGSAAKFTVVTKIQPISKEKARAIKVIHSNIQSTPNIEGLNVFRFKDRTDNK